MDAYLHSRIQKQEPVMLSSVPRGKIPWFPKIAFDACIGDQECVKFCKNDVFHWNEVKNRPDVIKPFNCVVGCDACSQICPAEAISFPSRDELRRIMLALVQEAHEAAGQPG